MESHLNRRVFSFINLSLIFCSVYWFIVQSTNTSSFYKLVRYIFTANICFYQEHESKSYVNSLYKNLDVTSVVILLLSFVYLRKWVVWVIIDKHGRHCYWRSYHLESSLIDLYCCYLCTIVLPLLKTCGCNGVILIFTSLEVIPSTLRSPSVSPLRLSSTIWNLIHQCSIVKEQGFSLRWFKWSLSLILCLPRLVSEHFIRLSRG